MLFTLTPLTEGQNVDSLFKGDSLSWSDTWVFEEAVADQVLQIPVNLRGAACDGLAVTFRHIWDACNKLREEGGTINPLGIAVKIKA
jgi:hypothetical protein